MYEYVIFQQEVNLLFFFFIKIVFLYYGRSNATRKLMRIVERKLVIEILRNFGTV